MRATPELTSTQHIHQRQQVSPSNVLAFSSSSWVVLANVVIECGLAVAPSEAIAV
jgi:hypothetical protein